MSQLIEGGTAQWSNPGSGWPKSHRFLKVYPYTIECISLSKYNAHTEPIFKDLNLLKVTDILKLQELKFYYKFINNKLPSYLQTLPFYSNTETHDHYTRTQDDIHQPFAKHDYAKKCIRYDLPKIINGTPTIILDKVSTHSLDGFSWYVKKYIVQSYETTCTIVNCYICSRN